MSKPGHPLFFGGETASKRKKTSVGALTGGKKRGGKGREMAFLLDKREKVAESSSKIFVQVGGGKKKEEHTESMSTRDLTEGDNRSGDRFQELPTQGGGQTNTGTMKRNVHGKACSGNLSGGQSRQSKKKSSGMGNERQGRNQLDRLEAYRRSCECQMGRDEKAGGSVRRTGKGRGLLSFSLRVEDPVY